MLIVLLFFLSLASAQYQLGASQRNAVGLGAASAAIGDHIYVVGGSGDETRPVGDPQITFLFRDTRRFSTSLSGDFFLSPSSHASFTHRERKKNCSLGEAEPSAGAASLSLARLVSGAAVSVRRHV